MTQIPVGGPPLPYGASAAGARAMIQDVGREGRPVGIGTHVTPARVDDARLEQWIRDAAGILAAPLWRLPDLPATATSGAAVADPTALTQDRVLPACRHLVELYAAALAQDVMHPERTGDNRPGAVLLARFWSLLDQLTAAVNAAVAATPDPNGEPGGATPDWVLPDWPLFTRTMGF